jgi:hypothetical protein
MTEKFEDLPSQNVFNLGCVTFASNFDNGNLTKVKKIELGLPFEYRIWVAPDNQGIVSLLSLLQLRYQHVLMNKVMFCLTLETTYCEHRHCSSILCIIS